MSEIGIKDQCFGVEVEMTGITREQASSCSCRLFWDKPTISWNWLRHLGSYRPGGKGMETDERCQYPGGTKNTDRIYLKCRNQLPCGNGHTKTHL